jgi:hypothetical protein
VTPSDADPGRRGDKPPWRGALLSAAAGAALFLGVGAALPVWVVELPTGPGGPAWPATFLGTAKVTLWEAASSTHWQLSVTDEVVLYPLLLLAGGVGAGLLGYFARVTVRRWKGGGV